MMGFSAGYWWTLGYVLLLFGLGLPASAQVAAQGASQDTLINGDNNQVTQVINQTIINHPGRARALLKEDKVKSNNGRYSREPKDKSSHKE
ncbi:hypothetical protein [Synechocystis sp. LKSZ1]|uniref:hypothetical protein n=1 Tax=Synechocystis sp. LKSZ1 TaxID=3144951 RepID=UPI00336BD851